MKKVSRLQVVYALSLIFFVAFAGINARKNVQDLPQQDVSVNPKYEQHPPIAGAISIKQLTDTANGNILFVADFGKSLEKQTMHAVMLGDEKIVLRDDGKNGDVKAADGKFSVVLKEDLVELQKDLNGSVQALLGKKEIPTFNLRVLEHTSLANFDSAAVKNFTEKKFLNLPNFRLPCSRPPIIIKENSLTITNASVVEDATRTFNPCSNTGNANGAWAFPKLISEMANTAVTGVTASDFLKKWLETWQNDVIVNTDTLKKRVMISRILTAWSNNSGGTFDIKFAPFKLIAIVNRVDLRGNAGYGFSNAGEARFVFCAITCSNGAPLLHRFPAPFMVILEYGIPKKKCADLKAFAKAWADLSSLTLGSAGYKTALENITNQFTLANTSPAKPNGSSLNQLRTNEFAFDQDPWELREFNIDNTTHQLKNVTVKLEPQLRFNKQHPFSLTPNVVALAKFVNDSASKIEANNYSIPLTASGLPFAAAHAHTLNPNTYHWNAFNSPGPGFINSDSARFMLSINTCSGCHGGEGNTGNFMQIAPGGTAGVPATLSNFLKGNPPMSSGGFVVTDRANRPSAPGKAREFNDLERRKADLEKFVSCECKTKSKTLELAEILRMRPLNMTH